MATVEPAPVPLPLSPEETEVVDAEERLHGEPDSDVLGAGDLIRSLLGGLVSERAGAGITFNVNVNLGGALGGERGRPPASESAGERGGDEESDPDDGADDGGDE